MRRNVRFILLAALMLGLISCLAGVTPMSGATFVGSIETGDQASSGRISFQIASDGASITDLDLILNQVRCDGLSMGRVHEFVDGVLTSTTEGGFAAAIPAMGREVNDYELNAIPSDFPAFDSLDDIGWIEGEFSSPTEARGTISIYVWVLLTDHACELGEFSWNAEVE